MFANSGFGSSRITRLIRSERWLLFTFFTITVPMMIHTQNLVLKVTGFHFDLFPYDEQLYGLLFAIGFDLAMITFAVNGEERAVGGLAVIVFLMNAIFLNFEYLYNIETVTDTGRQIAVKVLISLLIAGAASWIIHMYVMFYVNLIGQHRKTIELYGQVESAKKEAEQFKKQYEQLLKENKSAAALSLSDIQRKEQELAEAQQNIIRLKSQITDGDRADLRELQRASEEIRKYQQTIQTLETAINEKELALSDMTTKLKQMDTPRERKLFPMPPHQCQCGAMFMEQDQYRDHMETCVITIMSKETRPAKVKAK
jgi:hypothetical protein